MIGFGMLLELGITGILLVFLIMLIPVLAVIFWLFMIVDCLRRKFKESTDKIAWILVLIFIPVLGAISTIS